MKYRIYNRTSGADMGIYEGECREDAIRAMIADGDLITPTDSESLYLLHEIPIVAGRVGSPELAQAAAAALADHRGAIIKGHGPIAVGKIVEEAFVHICSVEHACRVKYFVDLAQQGAGDARAG